MSDDDFDYSREEGVSGELGGDDFMGPAKARAVQNQPHDEEVALSDTESFGGADDPPNAPGDASLIESHDIDDVSPSAAAPTRTISPPRFDSNTSSPGALSSSPAVGGGEDASSGGGAPLYNAQDYRHLNVSDDIRDLFQFIGRYKPQHIELETKLKPFIPDYIPAVGGIDEFIKVPRPDGKSDFLGLKVLDEPAAKQSDPDVLALQLKQLSKEAPGRGREIVGHVEHRDENKAKRIQQWMVSIADIHKAKPPASVVYSRRMPELEALMQEWHPELEAGLRNAASAPGGSGATLPPDLDVDLMTYTKLVCGLLDIPVYQNPIESLHVLFSLYLEFKNNPIFRQHLELENRILGTDGDTGGFGGGEDSINIFTAS